MSPKAKKQCPIDALGITSIDYKDTELLKKYLTKFNRIVPRFYSGTSLKNQKKLAQAIKRARYMALLPYVLDVKYHPTSTPASTPVGEAPEVLDAEAVAL